MTSITIISKDEVACVEIVRIEPPTRISQGQGLETIGFDLDDRAGLTVDNGELADIRNARLADIDAIVVAFEVECLCRRVVIVLENDGLGSTIATEK